MRIFKISALLYFLLLSVTVSFAQYQFKEKDYVIDYLDDKLLIAFNATQEAPIDFKVVDATTQAPIIIENQGNSSKSYLLNHLHPAQILKVTYTTLESGQPIEHTQYVGNKSLSTGTITVYFNHNVDTNYSQTQFAVNLADTLDNKLIEYINNCQSTLDIAIYNSSSLSATTGIAGAINAAYMRGVQVRVIYDGSTGGNMISLLNAAIPVWPSPTTSSYGIMHNKFVIFDANNADANKPVVWTGSTNWTLAQIDGPDKNSAIIIQDQTLALAYKIEFEEMWGSTTMVPDATVSKFGPYKIDNTPHHFIIGGKNVDSYFSPSDGANSKIVAAINSANSDINIATMLITRTDIKNALVNKFNAGLTDINIVLDSQNPVSNQFTNLQTALLPNHIVQYTGSGIMHHKFMVVDNFNTASDPLVVVGSHNWSTSAETKNDENMLIVHDANIANQYFQAFAYLYPLAGGLFSGPLAVNNYTLSNGWVLYPNPTNGKLTIENQKETITENVTVTVTDALGKTIMTKPYTSFSNEAIDLSNQTVGLYFITLQTASKTFHFKVMKN